MTTTDEVNPVRGKDSKSPGSPEAGTSNGVKKLAELARITIPDTDLEKFTSEFDAILEYIAQLEALEIPDDLAQEKPLLHNVLRDDTHPTAPGTNTEKLAEQFPEREGDALVVKQIISYE
ncbi:MAG TPA: Asp-tRNA(Asn)/Glu-tRNA(Gln) amidotransferase subunit GatC [Candidatus Paceibacterota bacterium]|nr:Asp-tRNA(Asn)/Glu-tRNA(Gln) amidotransferase subunit GatC [Candidatus Paceibacterota bacterium]